MKRRMSVAAMIMVAVLGPRPGTAAPATAASTPFDPSTLKPFTDGAVYLGKYQTGLYPEGKNEIPAAHRQAGQRVAVGIRPLDVDGKPDNANGRILAVAIGHSNTKQYFEALQQRFADRADQLNPRFELINAGVGSLQLPQIRGYKSAVWERTRQLLSRPGYSLKQVQILLHTTYHVGFNRTGKPLPPESFPEIMKQMQKDLAEVLRYCVKTNPSLKIAYLTCDGFRHYSGFEPHVWQEAFAFKWLIESQIKGEEGTAFEDQDGKPRVLPWLQWGPYIWDNTWDRSYFTDGVHPAPKARAIFVDKCWRFLVADPVTRSWLWKDGQPPAPTGTSL